MIVKLVAATELLDTSFGYETHWASLHPVDDDGMPGCGIDEPVEFLAIDGTPTDDLGESLDANGGSFVLNPEWEEWFHKNIPTDADELGEVAGRLCYLSWDRPNPQTALNSGYIANIIRQQHFSVLEHASATFYLGQVSRSFTHELVRHRHLSFSQVSQRYVDESEFEVVYPPINDGNLNQDLRWYAESIRTSYEEVYNDLLKRGVHHKKAREAARALLPNATATQILVTGNLRAWRDVLAKRLSPGADAEFQLVAREILEHLLKIAPASFQDLKELIDG